MKTAQINILYIIDLHKYRPKALTGVCYQQAREHFEDLALPRTRLTYPTSRGDAGVTMTHR